MSISLIIDSSLLLCSCYVATQLVTNKKYVVPFDNYIAEQQVTLEQALDIRIFINNRLVKDSIVRANPKDHVVLKRIVTKNFSFQHIFSNQQELIGTIILLVLLVISFTYHIQNNNNKLFKKIHKK